MIILFTDEKIDDGVSKMESVGENFSTLERVMEKINQRHISFHYFGPQSSATEVIEQYPDVFMTYVKEPKERTEDEDIWANIGFEKILEGMAKSISRSKLQLADEGDYSRAVYGQNAWPENSWN